MNLKSTDLQYLFATTNTAKYIHYNFS